MHAAVRRAVTRAATPAFGSSLHGGLRDTLAQAAGHVGAYERTLTSGVRLRATSVRVLHGVAIYLQVRVVLGSGKDLVHWTQIGRITVHDERCVSRMTEHEMQYLQTRALRASSNGAPTPHVAHRRARVWPRLTA